MKNPKFIAVISMLLGFGLTVLPVYAQSVPADLANAAKEACISSAKSKGFQVDQIVSIAPSGGSANVVLNLSRDGHPFKLTCEYSKTAGAAIGNDSIATTSASPDLRPLWWLLVSVIGLPLLLLWARGRDLEVRAAVEHYKAIVHSNGNTVNIRSGPSDSYNVTGVLHDMQQVVLSGRQNDNWVELSEGGWVSSQYLELALLAQPEFQSG